MSIVIDDTNYAFGPILPEPFGTTGPIRYFFEHPNEKFVRFYSDSREYSKYNNCVPTYTLDTIEGVLIQHQEDDELDVSLFFLLSYPEDKFFVKMNKVSRIGNASLFLLPSYYLCKESLFQPIRISINGKKQNYSYQFLGCSFNQIHPEMRETKGFEEVGFGKRYLNTPSGVMYMGGFILRYPIENKREMLQRVLLPCKDSQIERSLLRNELYDRNIWRIISSNLRGSYFDFMERRIVAE